MAFDAMVEDAIVAALTATGAVDAVYTSRLPAAEDQSAEDLRAVSILPIDGSESDEFDDTSGYLTVDERLRLVFIVRAQDPSARDLALRTLFALAQNTLNGQSLGGVTLPAFTRFRSWKWEDPQSSESRLSTVFQYRYFAPSWTGFDAST